MSAKSCQTCGEPLDSAGACEACSARKAPGSSPSDSPGDASQVTQSQGTAQPTGIPSPEDPPADSQHKPPSDKAASQSDSVRDSSAAKREFIASIRRPEERSSTVEYTEPLKPFGSELPKLKEDDVRKWRSTLRSRRILILNSISTELLDAAYYAIASSEYFNGVDRRMLHFGGSRVDKTKVTPEELLHEKNSARNALIIVEATQPQASLFLDGLLHSSACARSIEAELTRTDRYLLVVSTPAVLKEQEREVFSSKVLERADIPFLVPLILHHKNATETEADGLARVIEEQQRRGLWGENQKAMYRAVRTCLEAKRLKEEIARLRNVKPAEIVLPPEEDELQLTVLYLATFFEDLTADDFERVLLKLLGDRTEFVAPAASAAPAGGSAPPPPRLLRDRWAGAQRRILQSCGLTIQPRAQTGKDPRTHVVGFAQPERNTALHKEFTAAHHHFLQSEMFERIQEAGLLFDECPEVVDGTIKLAVETARSRPSRYGQTLLIDMIQTAGPAVGWAPSASDSPEERLRGLFAHILAKWRDFIFSRVHQLMRALLEHPELRPIVESAIHELRARGAFDAVLELVDRLWSANGFQPFTLLKSVFEMDHPGVSEAAVELLLRKARLGPEHLLEVLKEAHRWLTSDTVGSLSPLQRCALKLRFRLAEEHLRHASLGAAPSWPPAHPLLACLGGSSPPSEDQAWPGWMFHPAADELIDNRWMFHARLLIGFWLVSPAVRRLIPDHEDALCESLAERCFLGLLETMAQHSSREPLPFGRDLFRALLLADWAVHLRGTQGQPEVPERERLRQSILEDVTLHLVSRPILRRRIVAHWVMIEALIIDVAACLRSSPARKEAGHRTAVQEQAERLLGARRAISELRGRVVAARPAAPTAAETPVPTSPR